MNTLWTRMYIHLQLRDVQARLLYYKAIKTRCPTVTTTCFTKQQFFFQLARIIASNPKQQGSKQGLPRTWKWLLWFLWNVIRQSRIDMSPYSGQTNMIQCILNTYNSGSSFIYSHCQCIDRSYWLRSE